MTGMEINKGLSSIEIIFDFKELPQYRVDVSGQRVDLIMSGTSFSSKFERIQENEDIIRILYHESPEESVISLLLKGIPEDVNSSTSDEDSQITLDISWPEVSQSSRPAIDYDIDSDLHFDNHKATARRYITSKYSGNWRKFIEEFEWPIELTPSRNYFFPEFPCYMGSNPDAGLDKSILENGYRGYWNRALESLKEAKKTSSAAKMDLLRLIECDLSIRQGQFETAKKVSDELMGTEEKKSLQQWFAYVYGYSLAMTGKKYRAYYELRDLCQDVAKNNDLRSYGRILLAELALATDRYKEAFRFFSEKREGSQYIQKIFRLRRADCLYQLAREQKALEWYQSLSPCKHFLETHPRSLAAMARLVYKKGLYAKSYVYFSLLSKANTSLQERSLALYWAAVSLYRQGKTTLSRQYFQNTLEEFPGTEGGLRARMKLNDICFLREKNDWQTVFSEYQDIAGKAAEYRDIREESVFKGILALYEANKKKEAVELLERFLRDYAGGKLRPQAEALMVEVLPDVVRRLVDRKKYFQAMVLVEKNRELLITSPLSLKFLTSLAKAFFESALFDRAEKVYSYVLAGADTNEVKDDIFLLLIKTLFEKKEMDRVVDYADRYCNQYPDGDNLIEIYLYKVRALRVQNKKRRALRALLEKERPVSDRLDRITGQLLFDFKKYNRVEDYMSRGMDPNWKTVDESMILLRAEALYRARSFPEALTYYNYLIQKNSFADQAMYRRGRILYKMGQDRKSFNVLQRLVEKGNRPMWKKLAREFLALHKG